MKKFRTPDEEQVGKNIERIFDGNPLPVEVKLENFPKYVRRQHLKRFLAMYEIFKQVLPVKGSVIDCGVYQGFSLMSWAKLSAMLEPENLTRRVYGFDTFSGFPSTSTQDDNPIADPQEGDLAADVYEELQKLIVEYDRDRFLGHIDKVHLVKGDAVQTIPHFIESNPHLVVSLLFLDFDLYEPTRVAIEHFIPRMPKGAVIALDELDNPMWPGETVALLGGMGIRSIGLQRFVWDPYISFAILE